jgi:hypothetical protein
MMSKIIGTTGVWLTGYKNYDDLRHLIDKGDSDGAIQYVAYSSNDMKDAGWTPIGMATVHLELDHPADVARAQLDVLQAELQNHRAESQMRENQILERISKLQALTYEVA